MKLKPLFTKERQAREKDDDWCGRKNKSTQKLYLRINKTNSILAVTLNRIMNK